MFFERKYIHPYIHIHTHIFHTPQTVINPGRKCFIFLCKMKKIVKYKINYVRGLNRICVSTL